MIKAFLCLLVSIAALMLPGTTAVAQEPGWTFSYDPQPLGDLEPYDLKPTADGGVLVLGRAQLTDSAANHFVVKFTANGDRSWFYEIGFLQPAPGSSPYVAESASIDVAPDGSIYVVSSSNNFGLVVRLDEDGGLVWQERLELIGAGFSILHYNDLDASVSGDVVVAGVRLIGFPIYLPYDDVVMLNASDGTIRWRKTATASTTRDQGVLAMIKRGASGAIALVGQTDVPDFGFDVRVLLMGAAGGVMWHGSIPTGGSLSDAAEAVTLDEADQMTVLASPFEGAFARVRLTRFDSLGTPVFETLWSPSQSVPATASALLERPSGDFWVAGSVDDAPALIRFDGAGQFLGMTSVSAAGAELGSLREIAEGPDGAVHAIGTLTTGATPNEAILVAFDASGDEVYSRRLTGQATVLTDDRFGGVDVAFDARGNVFSLTQAPSAASGDLRLIAAKTISGSSVGASYCGPAVANSTGVPASLDVLGSEDVVDNNLSLIVTDAPAGSFVLLLASQTQGFAAQAGGGQGTLCLGGAIGRYVGPGEVRRAGQDGTAYLQLELSTVPQPTGLVQASAGETWNFQAWYRDANPAITSNFTDGASLTLR